MVKERKEIKALLKLLDDSDQVVYNEVKVNLLKFGLEIIPELEKAWEESNNKQFQERIENIINQIQFESSKKLIEHWIEAGASSLLEGVVYFSRFQYPTLTIKDIEEKISKISKDIWLEINNNLTALEKVRIINYFIFDVYKFKRNLSNYYSPSNYFINQVLNIKKGNAISLGLVYLLVSEKLGLPLYGVNLPGNFLVAYKDEYRLYDSQYEIEDILFYINPFNKGIVLTKQDIDHYLKSNNMPLKIDYYKTIDNVQIIRLLVNDLIYTYEFLQYPEKVEYLKRILTVLDKL